MRVFTDLCVLTALYGGHRDDLTEYLRVHYAIQTRTFYSAALRLYAPNLVARQQVKGTARKTFRYQITSTGRAVCDEEMAVVAARVDQLSHLNVPAGSLLPAAAGKNTVMGSAEWRVLLVMLRYGSASAERLKREAGVDDKSVRSQPSLTHADEDPEETFWLTDIGRQRAQAALAMGRRMCNDWRIGSSGR